MPPDQDLLFLTVIRRIDAACDRFETDWQAAKQPRIEAFLGSVEGAERAALLRALLEVEVELRRKQGATPTIADYEQRFPQDLALLATIFAPTLRQTPVAPSIVDTSVAQEAGIATDSFHPVPEKPAVAPVEALPKRIGRFEIIDVLGSGAFGKVYRARDPQLDREVALKVPLAGTLTLDELERFLREARAAATIQHPNVCPVFEVGQEGNTHFIVMAYIAGKSLATHLKERKEPMASKQAVLVVRKLALALEAAHKKGIVHRDLKPANIMFDRDRKDVIVMDFGMARRIKVEDGLQTQSGAIMGTPAYMSPEQAEGNIKAIGPASDVFSLGVILYELLCGQRPFQGSMMAVMGQIMHVEPEPPSKVRAGVDPRLEAICKRALAKKPADRYASMKQMADALEEYLKGKEAGSSGVSTAKDEAGETKGFAEIMAAMSAERKADTAAVMEAAVQRAKTPRWVWIVALGFMALILLGGIIFFFRTPTMTVMVNIDVDLTDKTLTFFLDGNQMPAEYFNKPVELGVGEHTLIVKRGQEIVRKYTFTVSKDAGPRIELKEEHPPKQEPQEPKDRRKIVWQSVLSSPTDVNAKTVWEPDPDSKVTYQAGLLEMRGARAQYTPIGFHATNYIFRANVKKLQGANMTLRLRRSGMMGYVVYFNGVRGNEGHFGLAKNSPHFKGLQETWVPMSSSDFFELAISAYGDRISAYVDGRRILDLHDADHASGKPSVNIRAKAHVILRNLEVCVMDGTDLTPDDVYPQAQPAAADPERALAEWYLRNGGWVRVTTGTVPATMAALEALPVLSQASQLPPVPFKLVWVNRTNGSLDEEARRLLPLCRNLVSFFHWAGGFTDGDLALLKECKELRALWLEHTWVTDAGLSQLKGMPKLQHLKVSHAKVKGVALADLSALPLEVLWLGPTVSQRTVDAVCRFPNLVELHFDSPEVTDAMVKQLVHALPRLRALSFARAPVTDECLREIGRHATLEHLTLSNSRITDAGLPHVASCKSLRALTLDGCRVTDAGLKHLASFKQRIDWLSLSHTNITDAGVAILGEFARLSWYLNLEETKVTDACLPHLARMRNLQNLNLKGTKLTNEGLWRLKQALPKCNIQPEPKPVTTPVDKDKQR